MLLKKEKPAQIDPLENWPEHYYKIENAKERKEILAQAMVLPEFLFSTSGICKKN